MHRVTDAQRKSWMWQTDLVGRSGTRTPIEFETAFLAELDTLDETCSYPFGTPTRSDWPAGSWYAHYTCVKCSMLATIRHKAQIQLEHAASNPPLASKEDPSHLHNLFNRASRLDGHRFLKVAPVSARLEDSRSRADFGRPIRVVSPSRCRFDPW